MKSFAGLIKVAGILALSGLALLGVLAMPSVAGAKETMLYHGNGFAIRPASVYNWKYDGYQSGMTGGQDIGGPKGSGTSRLPNGRVTWKRWNHKSAVGTGALWTYCGTLTKKQCKSSLWYGTPRVRLHLYSVKSGHFSKMKITRLRSKRPQYMVLKFLGKHRTPAWKIVRDVGP